MSHSCWTSGASIPFFCEFCMFFWLNPPNPGLELDLPEAKTLWRCHHQLPCRAEKWNDFGKLQMPMFITRVSTNAYRMIWAITCNNQYVMIIMMVIIMIMTMMMMIMIIIMIMILFITLMLIYNIMGYNSNNGRNDDNNNHHHPFLRRRHRCMFFLSPYSV